MKFCEQTWNKLLITRIDLSNNAKVVTFFRGHIWSTFSASWNFFGVLYTLTSGKMSKLSEIFTIQISWLQKQDI